MSRATLPPRGHSTLIVVGLVSLHIHLVSPNLGPLAAGGKLPLPAVQGVIVFLALVSAGLLVLRTPTWLLRTAEWVLGCKLHHHQVRRYAEVSGGSRGRQKPGQAETEGRQKPGQAEAGGRQQPGQQKPGQAEAGGRQQPGQAAAGDRQGIDTGRVHTDGGSRARAVPVHSAAAIPQHILPQEQQPYVGSEPWSPTSHRSKSDDVHCGWMMGRCVERGAFRGPQPASVSCLAGAATAPQGAPFSQRLGTAVSRARQCVCPRGLTPPLAAPWPVDGSRAEGTCAWRGVVRHRPEGSAVRSERLPGCEVDHSARSPQRHFTPRSSASVRMDRLQTGTGGRSCSGRACTDGQTDGRSGDGRLT